MPEVWIATLPWSISFPTRCQRRVERVELVVWTWMSWMIQYNLIWYHIWCDMIWDPYKNLHGTFMYIIYTYRSFIYLQMINDDSYIRMICSINVSMIWYVWKYPGDHVCLCLVIQGSLFWGSLILPHTALVVHCAVVLRLVYQTLCSGESRENLEKPISFSKNTIRIDIWYIMIHLRH